MNKKELYKSLMNKISKLVKKSINEGWGEDYDEVGYYDNELDNSYDSYETPYTPEDDEDYRYNKWKQENAFYLKRYLRELKLY